MNSDIKEKKENDVMALIEREIAAVNKRDRKKKKAKKKMRHWKRDCKKKYKKKYKEQYRKKNKKYQDAPVKSKRIFGSDDLVAILLQELLYENGYSLMDVLLLPEGRSHSRKRGGKGQSIIDGEYRNLEEG